MIIVQGWIRLDPATIERLRPAALEMVRATREESGCQEYAFAVDLADPGLLRLTERWVDQAALDAHFASPHMAVFAAAMGQAKVEAASVKSYEGEYVRTLMGE